MKNPDQYIVRFHSMSFTVREDTHTIRYAKLANELVKQINMYPQIYSTFATKLSDGIGVIRDLLHVRILQCWQSIASPLTIGVDVSDFSFEVRFAEIRANLFNLPADSYDANCTNLNAATGKKSK